MNLHTEQTHGVSASNPSNFCKIKLDEQKYYIPDELYMLGFAFIIVTVWALLVCWGLFIIKHISQ